MPAAFWVALRLSTNRKTGLHTSQTGAPSEPNVAVRFPFAPRFKIHAWSYQSAHFPLGLGVAVDIPRRGLQARMTGKLLHIAQRAACLADLARRARDESAAAGMRRTARHAERRI